MSITNKGITIERGKRKKVSIFFLTILEVILSIILVISLSANLIFPRQTQAGPGVAQRLSYQGRLTDLSGNPLGGASGTNYCFRFSIFDTASGGTKLWPSGTPASVTVKVKDGVFNTAVQDGLASMGYDFTQQRQTYLNVEVNATPTTCSGAWEQLDLRQRIDAVAYARAAEFLYSDIARVASGSGKFQLGTGAGAATPIFLNLDWKNTNESVDASCTTSGQIWYNSFDSKARVCDGGTIQDLVAGILVRDEGTNVGRASTALNFVGAGVNAVTAAGGVINISVNNIQGIAVNALTTYTSGTVVISAGANITLGTAGQTITISAPAGGGGGGATLSNFQWPPAQWSSLASSISNAVMTIVPFTLPQQLTATRAMAFLSLSGNTNSSGTYSISIAIFTRNVSTLSLASSGSTFHGWASSNVSGGTAGSIFGNRRMSVPININATPGDYYYAIHIRTSNNGLISVWHGAGVNVVFHGNVGGATNSSRQLVPGLGIFSNASFTTAIPSSIAISNIKGGANVVTHNRQPWILFTNFDLN